MSRVRHTLIGAACGWVFASPSAAHACTIFPFPTFRDRVHMIVTAEADTLMSGPGPVRHVPHPGETDRHIYGQVARVERVGGVGAAMLPAAMERVVLVPWEVDNLCRTTRWALSARWVQPGIRALFTAIPRPREHWAGGLPTFDLYSAFHAPPDSGDQALVLSVDQLFGLLERLPLGPELAADPEGAYRPVLEWLRADPGRARLSPASQIAWITVLRVRDARLGRVRPPLAGTYRFTASVNGGEPLTFHARTSAVPESEWRPYQESDSLPGVDDPLQGYYLWLTAAGPAGSLEPCMGGRCRRGLVLVLANPEPGPDGARVWRGDVDLSLLSSALPDNRALAQAARAEFARFNRRADAGEPEEILARFVLRPDGSVVVEQTSVLDDGQTVTIRGERVSRDSFPRPEPEPYGPEIAPGIWPEHVRDPDPAGRSSPGQREVK